MFVLLFLAFGSLNAQQFQLVQIDIDKPTAHVGGIFEEEALVEEKAFNSSLQASNGQLKLYPITRNQSAVNSLNIHQKACTITEKVMALFGPQVPEVDGALREMTAKAQIPHLQATWRPSEPEIDPENDACYNFTNPCDLHAEDSNIRCCFVTLDFYPDADQVSQAMANVLLEYGWSSFTILYEDNYGLMRIQKMLSTFYSLGRAVKVPLIIRKLAAGESNQAIRVLRNVWSTWFHGQKTEYRDKREYKITCIYGNVNVNVDLIFKELNEMHESRILLDCHVDNVITYLETAANSRMLNDYQSYILTSLEAHSISQELVDMVTLRANVSWLSMFEIEKRRIIDDPLKDKAMWWYTTTDFNTTSIKLETLLVVDAVNHLSTSAGILKDNYQEPPSICQQNGESSWNLGLDLQKALLKNISYGYSGNIQFDSRGKRINYRLYLHQMLNGEDSHTIGVWESSTEKFNESTKIEMSSQTPSSTSRKKTFIVMSKYALPFFGNKTEKDLKGNDRFEGYSVDIITEIFKVMKNQNVHTDYSFEFVIPDENTQGKYDPEKKQWNGLIGALLNKKADLVICDLTITEERKSVIDFSVPFMTTGISILFTKEHRIQPGRFSFLNPYSIEVWIYTATAYLLVSIVLFVSSRISPGDWENPQPCESEPEELENIWNFKNCTWLTMGSIMTQGCDILPKAFGSRWVCGMWWFFAMIVCQTYIAQLAASLTSALEDEPIKDVEDLANSKKIDYGCLDGGSTAQFFSHSKDKIYEKMWLKMNSSSRPTAFCKSNEDGAHRVLKSKNRYAFFMESTTIEYMAKRECELTQVGTLLDSKDYGIAMPANSPFRSQINKAILDMQQSGRLNEIKKSWWEKGAKTCEDEHEKGDVEGDLEMANLIGAFLVLAMGCALSVVIAAFEFLDHIRNIVISEREWILLAKLGNSKFYKCSNHAKWLLPICSKYNSYFYILVDWIVTAVLLNTYFLTSALAHAMWLLHMGRNHISIHYCRSVEISHREAFLLELKSSLNLFKLQKPVPGKSSRESSLRTISEELKDIEARPPGNRGPLSPK